MRIDPLGGKQIEPMGSKELWQRPHRVVVEMLVIDRIEQRALVDVQKIGNLENKDTVRRQQCVNRFRGARQIVDMRKHVVGGDAGCSPVLCGYFTSRLTGEEPWERFDPAGIGGSSNCLGGIDAEHLHARCLEWPQQRSVVGADINNEIAGLKHEAAHHFGRIVFKMADENR